MDGERFDALTRRVGEGLSRRSLFKGLLGLGGAAVATTIGGGRTEAA